MRGEEKRRGEEGKEGRENLLSLSGLGLVKKKRKEGERRAGKKVGEGTTG